MNLGSTAVRAADTTASGHSPWPIVPLGQVIEHRKWFITIDDTETYKRCRVQLHTRGIVLRDEIEGARIKTKSQQVCRPDEFLVAEIDAKVGGFGMVPTELDGAIVSSHYFLFTVDRSQLLPEFLGFYIRTPHFRDQVRAQGSTNYAAIRPGHVLEYVIPLPPLDEQRRIVAKIEHLAAKIDKAHGLRFLSHRESGCLLDSKINMVMEAKGSDVSVQPFGEFEPHVTSGPRNWSKYYSNSGYRFYRAQDISNAFTVAENSKQFLTPPDGKQGRSALLEPGDLMIVITGATVGRAALFKTEYEPGFVSQHVSICRLPKQKVDPDYALWYLRGPGGQDQLLGQRYGQGKPGLNLTNIKNISLPIRSLGEQRRIVAYLNGLQTKVDRVKALQNKTATELDALLPSILDKAFKGEL